MYVWEQTAIQRATKILERCMNLRHKDIQVWFECSPHINDICIHYYTAENDVVRIIGYLDTKEQADYILSEIEQTLAKVESGEIKAITWKEWRALDDAKEDEA